MVQKYLVVDFTEDEQRRIFSKIIIDPVTQCWNWIGAKMKQRGYGVFNYRGETISTHRLMYAWMIQPIPKGVGNGIPVIDHTVCNNRSCCNPKHMTLGSQKSNALRGNSPPTINSKKTHCINGHLLPTIPNEYWGNKRYGRRCIICRRIKANNRYRSYMSGPNKEEYKKRRRMYYLKQKTKN